MASKTEGSGSGVGSGSGASVGGTSVGSGSGSGTSVGGTGVSITGSSVGSGVACLHPASKPGSIKATNINIAMVLNLFDIFLSLLYTYNCGL
jgi:hypothetical protein